MQFLKVLLAALCLVAAGAQAQLRTIPAETKRGEIRHVQDMTVAINGVEQRLAPGAQIRDPSNRIVLPAALPAGAQVRYLVDAQGQVHRIWLLTPAEAAKK